MIPTVIETQCTDKESKISQLADDTVVFVDSVESGNIALEEIEQFGKFAGPKLIFFLMLLPWFHVQWTTDPVP